MLAAVLEAATGLALLIAPAVVTWLLLGADLPAAEVIVGRVAGCALVALGMACWPGRDVGRLLIPAAQAMLTYNLLITCYLVFLGIGGKFVGVLLWPAAAVHGLLTLLLIRERTKSH
jgi:hypothetical protein